MTIALARIDGKSPAEYIQDDEVCATCHKTYVETFPENVLGEPLTNRQFVIHLYGHLNYHLGQIDYLRRVLTGEWPINVVNKAVKGKNRAGL